MKQFVYIYRTRAKRDSRRNDRKRTLERRLQRQMLTMECKEPFEPLPRWMTNGYIRRSRPLRLPSHATMIVSYWAAA